MKFATRALVLVSESLVVSCWDEWTSCCRYIVYIPNYQSMAFRLVVVFKVINVIPCLTVILIGPLLFYACLLQDSSMFL